MTQQVILIVDNLLITQAVMTGIPPSNKDDSKKGLNLLLFYCCNLFWKTTDLILTYM